MKITFDLQDYHLTILNKKLILEPNSIKHAVCKISSFGMPGIIGPTFYFDIEEHLEKMAEEAISNAIEYNEHH